MVRSRFTVLPTLCWVLLRVAHSLALEDVSAGQQRLFTSSDKLVSVMSVKSPVPVVSTGIKSCLSPARPPSFKVRFQKLKGKGATFTRTLLNQGTITTYASKMKTVSSTSIDNCVKLADAGGFVGFSFNDGTCKLFNITPQTCGCCTEGQDVFYVKDSYWAPNGGPGKFSLTVIHGLSSIWAEWKPCNPGNSSTVAKFQLSWNNTIIVLNQTTFNYKLPGAASLCTGNLSQVPTGLKVVTLQAFDAAGTLLKTVTETLTERTGAPLAGRRYLLKSSNCMYYKGGGGAPFDALDTFCRTELHSTLFIAYVAGDYTTYREDLMAMRYNTTPSVVVSFHYVGLLKKDGIWTWQSGLTQPIVDAAVWSNTNGGSTCAETSPAATNFRVSIHSCDDTYESWVCHEYNR